ncbi:helix-turn-helix transcriptional regulator [Prevotella sp. oral taxon 376]|nr:LuxR C-terminal-related transcriptional regulator [Prevotella sp. oral taxon 376]PTL34197.1 helix-turn-helix transcriptional regulator [Prevotella sp. oral taxon 376]
MEMGKHDMRTCPRLAVVHPDVLAAIGMKSLLQNVLPMMEVATFGSFIELESGHPETFMHYFVSMNIVLNNRGFFLDRRRKTIVLTTSTEPNAQLSDFHCLCTAVNEKVFVQQLLQLEQSAHAHGTHFPRPHGLRKKRLSDREIEVLACLVKGKTNKEIAQELCIGLTTVISHRKNIQEKLGIKSVSALTIFAVTHGYVDMNDIVK